MRATPILATLLASCCVAAGALAQAAPQAAASAQAATPSPEAAQDADEPPGADETGKDGQLLASRRNYLDPKERDAPIVCKEGDLERRGGLSLGQVFGQDWPRQPAPAVSGVRARSVTPGKMVWPRGMEGKTGLVVVAVLVGADGKPLRAEPLCATTGGFDMAARRNAMDGTYEPALVDGKPVVSPVVRVSRFLPPRRKGPSRPRSATDE
jgi:hypothetical protein